MPVYCYVVELDFGIVEAPLNGKEVQKEQNPPVDTPSIY